MSAVIARRAAWRAAAALGLLVSLVPVASAVLAPAGPAAAAGSPSSSRACPPPAPGEFECTALVRTGLVPATARTLPPGYGPTTLRSAYSIPATTTGHPVVAVVDAYGDSHALADLTAYRQEFGLPPISACTTALSASLCFDQVTETGATTGYPPDDPGWDTEQALDIEMVSAACPQCSILLVEAGGVDYGSLAAAENEAVTLGAVVVSNSYSGPETTEVASAYTHPGVAIVAATGDLGYQAPSSPATYPDVVSVGGTTLSSVTPRTETAWSFSGSYCSADYPTPAWQQGVVKGCAMRAAADLSLDANPSTGVAIYDQGWEVVGGTSVGSPFVAAAIAAAGNWAVFGSGAGYVYGHVADLHPIISGSNGSCGTAMCVAGPGWNGPSGLGTPNGLGAL